MNCFELRILKLQTLSVCLHALPISWMSPGSRLMFFRLDVDFREFGRFLYV